MTLKSDCWTSHSSSWPLLWFSETVQQILEPGSRDLSSVTSNTPKAWMTVSTFQFIQKVLDGVDVRAHFCTPKWENHAFMAKLRACCHVETGEKVGHHFGLNYHTICCSIRFFPHWHQRFWPKHNKDSHKWKIHRMSRSVHLKADRVIRVKQKKDHVFFNCAFLFSFFFTLVFGLVVVAGFIRNACLVCVSVDSQVISSITRACPPTVYHVLDWQVGRRPRSSTLDVDTVLGKEQ